MAATILLVEDDAATARVLSRALTRSGYLMRSVETGSDAKAAVEQARPDLILLDLMLPDTDGLLLTTALKARCNAPVIICSGRQQQVDRVLGLKLGADDFVGKPFDLDELEARIEAVLRRAESAPPAPPAPFEPTDQIHVGRLTITPSRGVVVFAGQMIYPTSTEYRLLLALASRPGEILSRERLGQLVWGDQDRPAGHVIEVHIARLRIKLRRASPEPLIRTVRGRGFTIAADAAAASQGDDRRAGVAGQ
jgi:DNA-binding response OmpR family regulator